jgi:hypothetical protein
MVTPTADVGVGEPIVVTVGATCVEVGAADVVGAVVGAAEVVVRAMVVVGSGGRVVVVGPGLGGLIGLIVIGGIVMVVRTESRSVIIGAITIAAVAVTGGSSALTEVLLIGMLNAMNIPNNKLVNKTTTTRLNKVSVH